MSFSKYTSILLFIFASTSTQQRHAMMPTMPKPKLVNAISLQRKKSADVSPVLQYESDIPDSRYHSFLLCPAHGCDDSSRIILGEGRKSKDLEQSRKITGSHSSLFGSGGDKLRGLVGDFVCKDREIDGLGNWILVSGTSHQEIVQRHLLLAPPANLTHPDRPPEMPSCC